eukprot:scaffold23442_cov50-Phaeocystis_antarctica.AAC.1
MFGGDFGLPPGPRSPVLPPASIAPRWQLLGPAPTITGERAVPIAGCQAEAGGDQAGVQGVPDGSC